MVDHRITEAERRAIVEMAKEEGMADLRHRKLSHMLGWLRRVFV